MARLFLAVAASLVAACSNAEGGVENLTGGGNEGGLEGIDAGGGGLEAGLSDSTGVADTGNKCKKTLTGLIRDFKEDHPDFEFAIGDDRGLVKVDLGADGKPDYAPSGATSTTNGKATFDQWFRDVPGTNQTVPFEISMTAGPGGVFTYDNPNFFPIDGKLFGNEGHEHNFHFTYELRTTFLYKGGETFKFRGDDDLFTFVNKKLVIDLGGVHGAEDAEVRLDDKAAELGLVPGKTYPLDFFFAERHLSESNFRIDTTLDFVSCGEGIK